MYLYVEKAKGLAAVPEALLTQFGEPQLAMTLALHPGRALARADIETVLQALDTQGFYLQMPPQKEKYMLDLLDKNHKTSVGL